MKYIILLSLFLFTSIALADYTEKYRGIATNDKNEIVYIENHEATFFDNKKIKSAKTVYVNTKGKKIAELTSDFSKSLSAPIYKYTDFRHKTGHGIAYKEGKLQLIDYQKDGSSKTKFLNKKFSSNSIIVGGQGMHYYLRENFNKLKDKKDVPVIFLTPGNLDYYNFLLNYIGVNKKGLVELDIKISNFILRMFVSKLELQYEPKTKRLIQYKGLSNLSDDNDKMQAVTIKYKY